MKRSTIRSRFGALVGASLILCAGSVAAQTTKDECRPGQETSRLESKACPDGTVRQRACCTRSTSKGTKTRCKSFAHCPHRSRS